MPDQLVRQAQLVQLALQVAQEILALLAQQAPLAFKALQGRPAPLVLQDQLGLLL